MRSDDFSVDDSSIEENSESNEQFSDSTESVNVSFNDEEIDE